MSMELKGNVMKTTKRERVHAKTGGRCSYCGIHVSLLTFAVDHVTARKHGGSNRIENLMPACTSCNGAKGAKTVEDYRMYLVAKSVAGGPVFGHSQLLYLKEAGAFPVLGFDREHRFFFEVMT